MSKPIAVLILILVVTSASPLFAQTVLADNSVSGAAAPLPPRSAHALQISAGDLLDLDVFDTPELTAKLRVDDQGEVRLPVAGALAVRGLTAHQAGLAIEARFRETEVLKDPHVAVTVIEYATQGVTVLGEVKNPGVYPLLGSHGVLDLISAAGGSTANAGKKVTVTHRDDPSHPVTIELDSHSGNAASFSVDVKPGDTIAVSHAGIVYVVGDVGKPGGFLIENSGRLTVLQAIALAQGTNRTASLNHAKLIRKTDGASQELPVPLRRILSNKAADELLADGDILFVPSSAAKNALRDVEGILPQAAAAGIYHVP